MPLEQISQTTAKKKVDVTGNGTVLEIDPELSGFLCEAGYPS
jgi:hypothetical protein